MSMQMQAVRAFHAIPMFATLTEQETYDVLRICRMHKKSAGTILFRQGDPGSGGYLIESGTVDVVLEVEGKREVIARFGAGEVLGELSLIDPAPRSATAVVTADASIYEIPGDEFERLRGQFHPAVFKIIRYLSKVVCVRLRAVNVRIEARLNGRSLEPYESGNFPTARSSEGDSVRRVGPTASHSAANTASHAAARGRPPGGTGAHSASHTASTTAAHAAPTDSQLGDSEGHGGFIRRVISKFWTQKDEE